MAHRNILSAACTLLVCMLWATDHSYCDSRVYDPLNKWSPEEEDEIESFKQQWHLLQSDDSSQESWHQILSDDELEWLDNLGDDSEDDSDPRSIPDVDSEQDDQRRRPRRRRKAYRKEVRQMTQTEWNRYVRAVNMMKNSFPIPDNPRSEYDIFLEMHQFALSPAAHNGAAFLPWHREYLRRFEQALRRHVPGAAIPYWDSSLDQRLPRPEDSVLWTNGLLGNSQGEVTQGPFANFQSAPECQSLGNILTRRWAECPNYKTFLFSQEDLEYIMEKTSYKEISSNIDTKFEDDHGAVHVCVGGHMGSIVCSPADPIFYMHHAFIDCQWEEFRQFHQRTDIETDYPTQADGDIGGNDHEAYAPMQPFSYYRNIDGLSRSYTSAYYSCAERPTWCQKSSDCNSRYLWCNTKTNYCVSKIRQGGDCTGLRNVACYGRSSRCVGNRCG